MNFAESNVHEKQTRAAALRQFIIQIDHDINPYC